MSAMCQRHLVLVDVSAQRYPGAVSVAGRAGGGGKWLCSTVGGMCACGRFTQRQAVCVEWGGLVVVPEIVWFFLYIMRTKVHVNGKHLFLAHL